MRSSRTKQNKLNILTPTSQSYVDLPSPPNRSLLSPRLPYLNSTYSLIIPQHTRLSQLRNRNAKPSEITPQAVSTLLKTYFVPIFEAQRHKQQNLKTNRTVLFPNSLSEFLQNELEKSKKTLKNLSSQLKEIQNDKERRIKEINSLKKEIMNYQCTFEAAKIRKVSHKRKISSKLQRDHKKEFQEKSRLNEKAAKKLYLEKMNNYELHDKANTLGHYHYNYKKTNATTGERLKGLFFANNQLSTKTFQNFFKPHLKEIFDRCKELHTREVFNCNLIFLSISAKQNTAANALDILNERTTFFNEIKIQAAKFDDSRDQLTKKLKSSNEEKEQSLKKFQELEKKSVLLEDEYEKLYNIIKDIKKHKPADDVERVCKNCKQYYMEKNNFNWSCNVHTSEWGDSKFYYCCGATEKDAPGCKFSKHFSEEDSKRADTHLSSKPSKIQCITCGELGHTTKNCYKDPNPKLPSDFQTLKPSQKHNKKLPLVHYEPASDSDNEDFREIYHTKMAVAAYTSPRHETKFKVEFNNI